MKTIADRLKEGMAIRGLRQADIVEKTGINKGALSSYLSSRYEPKQNNIFLLAQALDVNEAWLMGADIPMERTKSLNFNETPAASPFNSALNKLQNGNYDLTNEEQDALKESLPKVAEHASKAFEKMYLQLSELQEKVKTELLLEYFCSLNSLGQDKAIEQVNLLTKVPEYQKTSATVISASEKSYLIPDAAHKRTDIEVTDDMKLHDDALMDDDDIWK